VFRQTYHAGAKQDVVTKTLQWQRVEGRWLITQETVGK